MRIKLMSPRAKIPTRGSQFAAGYDLYSANDRVVCVPPKSKTNIKTGIAVELDPDTFGGIFARSGLATNEGLRPTDCVGE